jgi:hypothetical protein
MRRVTKTLILLNDGEECPDGYRRDEFQPRYCKKLLPPCQHRDIQKTYSKCCGDLTKLYCKELKKKVTREECEKCPLKD